MTTHSSPPPDEQSVQRVRSKREQVLVACKVCRGRKTKCSGDRPRCRQCATRHQVCEWETLSDEAPRASKRKYLDLEQRSAMLMRRLRDGSITNDLLLLARELSNASHDRSSEGALTSIRQANMIDQPHETSPHIDLDSGANQNGRGIRLASRPTLPPISSIWRTHNYPAGPSGPPAPTAPTPDLTSPDNDGSGEENIQRNETASPQSLYDRWISQA